MRSKGCPLGSVQRRQGTLTLKYYYSLSRFPARWREIRRCLDLLNRSRRVICGTFSSVGCLAVSRAYTC